MTTEPLLTISQLSSWLQIPVATIYARRHRGEDLPAAVKIGNHLRWSPNVVIEWLEGRTETASFSTPPNSPPGFRHGVRREH